MATDPRQQLLDRRILGRGLRCDLIDAGADIGRDLSLAGTPGGRDLAVVEGAENLGQCLALALTTLPGDDQFNGGFGFDALSAIAEETDKAMVRERARVGVIRVLRADRRVARIIDVDLRGLDAGPAARSLLIEVSFLIASGRRVDVQVEGRGIYG